MIEIVYLANKDDALTSSFINNYLKRIKKWKVINIRVNPSSKKSKLVDNQILKTKIANDSLIIALDIVGQKLNSNELALTIENNLNTKSKISFVIGGADGLDLSLIKPHLIISLSNLLLTHTFARMLLIEQIYRSECILTNHPYHKE